MKKISEKTEEQPTVVSSLLPNAPEDGDGEGKETLPEEDFTQMGEEDTEEGETDTEENQTSEEEETDTGDDTGKKDGGEGKDDGKDNGKDGKKESLFARLKRLREEKKTEKERRKKEKDAEEKDQKDTGAGEDENGEEKDNEKKDKDKGKKDKGKKDKKSSGGLFRKKKEIRDEDEKTNPKIRLYNEIVRHALSYSKGPIDRSAVPDLEEVRRIFYYVQGDYPELFWLSTFSYTTQQIFLVFRCTKENGEVDVKQVERKRKALANAAKTFTRGITRKTKPYTALLTIYRRLILTLDYDGVGLKSGVGKNMSEDDSLRSLYSALVEHKVVCAGYAVAMQYLLHSVGISCAYVISEDGADGSCHAFNALRIGRECYYLDATWGDFSNTDKGPGGGEDKNRVFYDYCCVPLREFQMTDAAGLPMHTPRREYYPKLEKFTATRFEYFRHRKAFLARYDENELVRIFTDAAIAYQPKEMGDFQISFRCADIATRDYTKKNLVDKSRIFDIFRMAKANLPPKYKKKQYLLDVASYTYICSPDKSTFYCFPQLKNGKKR